ncbi:zinc finger protein 652-A-like [Schistocerca piceifrons]|uniref:zinc finger protein 652-A-like n=1 Tax=Schistocerca piceifrons TaxID=274613 RepID=UPI001F5F456C|nr:zinc finger protein 652-A-like [Schistocerca piceifrons]
MYSVYTMPETTDEEILKNGHGEDFNTEDEEEEDNEHNSNGIAAEANGWCARQGNVDGNRVILVGRIDPMEHVEPVYGTDEDIEGDNDDDDEDNDDGGDSPAVDRDGCGSDCSHGRSEEIAAESDGSVLDAWSGIHPEVSLVTRDAPLPVNSEVPGGPQEGPTNATFVYGDTLIFRGAPKIPNVPSPRVLSPASGMPLLPHSRPGGLGNGSGARTYDCPVCEKTFPDRESRARHAQEHEQFHCDVCGRGFRDEVERDHHASMYAGKPAHKCDACGKCFHLTHSFARHMRTHTGEQPFACDVCGKRFNDSGNMAKHMRTHTGDLPYPCPQCPRR